MKTIRIILVSALMLSSLPLLAQSEGTLPVYQVVQSGATTAQALVLAESLNVPTNMLSRTNGQVVFCDPTNFMAVPTLPVMDPVVVSNLLAQTPNKAPGIPIRIEQLDFATLSNLTVLSSSAAVTTFGGALANAGLYPSSAAPIVTHTLLIANFTNDVGSVTCVSNFLDTKVNYQMALGSCPLVGPGAQVQADFLADGSVSRLLYSTRQLTPGPLVNIISLTTASNRVAALMPGFDGQISLQLVYYAPPFSLGTVSNIIPCYLCSASSMLTNPATGEVSPMNWLTQVIPATDDTNFVPMLNLAVGLGNGNTQVVASASVSGGVPPYDYIWSGEGAEVLTNSGPQLTYTPIYQVVPPEVTVGSMTGGVLSLSWPDPTGLFRLQTASNLQDAVWSPVAADVTTSNGFNSATLAMNALQTAFFRLAVSNQLVPVTENVEVFITDRNGVTVRQTYPVPAYAILSFVKISGLSANSWGTESPYDEDIGLPDTQSWVEAMRNNGAFGVEKFYYGAYKAWPNHFMESGLDPYVVDAADITFYVGHGDPDAISFTTQKGGPSAPGLDLLDTDWALSDSWGDLNAEWLCLLSCDVLDTTVHYQNGPKFSYPQSRWGRAFNGLHLMLGFASEAFAAHTDFEKDFVDGMGAAVGPNLTIQQSWFNAALKESVGEPAVIGPIGPDATCDANDHWWGKGPVGPRIKQQQIHGWYYMSP